MPGVGPYLGLRLNPNSENQFYFYWKDENGTAIDFTGSTFKLQVKARDSDGEPTGNVLLTLSTGSGISGAVADGEWFLLFPKYVASPLAGLPAGEYVYDCLRFESAVAVDPLCWGFIDVAAGITS